MQKTTLSNYGLKKDEIFTKGRNDLSLPGWFRPSKQWDVLAFLGDSLVSALEIKAILSSYGNNFNNRIEEALGDSVDSSMAVNKNMFGPFSYPPLFGYILIMKKEYKSFLTKGTKMPSGHFKTDEVFAKTSYLEKAEIACKRMLSERLYQAVWFVTVDPKTKAVEEPCDDLSFERFSAALRGQVSVFNQKK